MDKKVRELDKYARDRCENQPFIRVENLAKIQSEVNYKVESAELLVQKIKSKVSTLEQQIQKVDLLVLSNRSENLKSTERFVTEQHNAVTKQLKQFQSKLEQETF